MKPEELVPGMTYSALDVLSHSWCMQCVWKINGVDMVVNKIERSVVVAADDSIYVEFRPVLFGYNSFFTIASVPPDLEIEYVRWIGASLPKSPEVKQDPHEGMIYNKYLDKWVWF